MPRTGVAELPLHGGHCPRWLFPRMRDLGGAIAETIVFEYGEQELLRRMADPFFFQSLGCVLGFDWHSSGLTTTVCGALKEGVNSKEIGIAICGGKGKTSRKTPSEIETKAEDFSLSSGRTEDLVYASKLAAKVDNSALQDGYQLYHHVFVLSEDGDWAVIQQGMNDQTKYARRYHWLSETLEDFVEEPHSAICSQRKESKVLDMTAKESKEVRNLSVELAEEPIEKLQRWLAMPRHHDIRTLRKQTIRTFEKIQTVQPESYEELLAIQGVGPAAVRALALISEVVYGSKASWSDPAKFSFAHGGKDGIPYPVDRKTYDRSIETLEAAIQNARIGDLQRTKALKRLSQFVSA